MTMRGTSASLPAAGFLLLTLLVARLAGSALAHSYHTGSCPDLKGMPNFQLDRFLGEWFVVQKTKSSTRCLVNNYTRDASTENQINLEQSSAHAFLGLTAKDGRYRYSGVLTPRENATSSSEMTVRFKLNVAGSAAYTVVTTDYNGHAAVVSCQDLPVGYRLSASMLSRTRKLHPGTVEKVRSILAADGIDVDVMTDLEQDLEACQPPKEGEGFHGAVQRAGEVLGHGVQAIKDGAKKLYDKVRGQDSSSEEHSRETMTTPKSTQIVSDAKEKVSEWLP